MKRRRMDDGRHGIRHEIDYAASVIAGEQRTMMVCHCGVRTGDFAGHLRHSQEALRVPGPAWFPIGARLAVMLVAGIVLLFGLMAIANTMLTGTDRTVLLGISPVVSFGFTMGAARALRRFIVPLAPTGR
ncbi:hypothetical protein [Streptomyces sp. bgisy060]|uniref:hypothetical protein n=1 Tax=Streptomyces sp. bgisy060 TaxID=3413775 RepID=UPI003EBD4FD1